MTHVRREAVGTAAAKWPVIFMRETHVKSSIREELDRQTRQGSVVVAIENPVDSDAPGPPPLSGAMCGVELRGRLQTDRIVIPQSALHDEHVFVLDGNSRLQRRTVEVDQIQLDCVVLQSGLQECETLVVSDPTPAIIGQLITAETDNSLAASIRQQASGEANLR